MIYDREKYATMPLGVVVRRTPGATRWAAWAWQAVAVLPGAGDARWHEMRREGEAVEYHAATCMLELHGAETESYLHGLSAQVPAIYVVMRGTDEDDAPLEVTLVTASPYEAQDYADNGEDIVEKVPMPAGLIAWVRDFVDAHHEDQVFKKRRRDKTDIGKVEDGVGDPRIRQMADVYRTPQSIRKEQMH